MAVLEKRPPGSVLNSVLHLVDSGHKSDLGTPGLAIKISPVGSGNLFESAYLIEIKIGKTDITQGTIHFASFI